MVEGTNHEMPSLQYGYSDAEWKILEPLVPAPLPGGRPVTCSRREIVNAILYVLRTSCQWRRQGIWEQINATLRENWVSS